MSNIQRWSQDAGAMFKDEDGKWCSAEDVAQIESINDKLLEALKEIIEQADGRNNSVMGQDRAYCIARAAIAKFEGTK